MVSAKGLIYQTRNTLELLKSCPEDSPLIVQLYGNSPQIIQQAVSILMDQGYHYFDLNCGCSVKKVVKTGAGAALLKDTSLLVETALAMIEKAGQGKAGIKIRLGWSNQSLVYLDLARALERSGLGWITLHPRTAVQLFSGQADHDALKKLKQNTRIPVIASGDLFTAADAADCVRRTGVDNIMFARGALNNPFIFSQYKLLRMKKPIPPVGPDFLAKICCETVSFYRQHCSSPRAVLKMRTILPRMIKNVPGAKELRKELIMGRNWDDIQRALSRITSLKPNSP